LTLDGKISGLRSGLARQSLQRLLADRPV
jgi:hypothetical protein